MPTRRDLANAIRALSMDAVQQAKSGHPGAPMGMADIAEVVWNDFLKHNPQNPNWVDRDRFVLSNGHGSMLIYSLLHLTGYDLSIDDLKAFRQMHSKTPGHPEHGYAPGVETTTGPLGQGIANAVGMALAESILAAKFNRDDAKIVDHHTYAFLGDGCLMEGISHEACSLAGTLKLGKLIALYDDNNISIDGEVEGWFTDDTAKRFESYGWHVIADVDGHDADAIKAAVEEAKSVTSKPTIICCKTLIGFGSPNKQGKESSHGAPLGDDEIALTRKELNWPHAAFEVPDDIYAGWDAKSKGETEEQIWNQAFTNYQAKYPELAAEFNRRIAGDLPENWSEVIDTYIESVQASADKVASRKASQMALNVIGEVLPELLGGSADLAGSNLTINSASKGVSADDKDGNYMYYGVREFGMSAIMNGVTLHRGFIPYGGTFLMFSEYARNALRMAALMKQQSIFVFTHDSIGLGEDGPTHQPVEQASTLRLMPNMSVWRPCDVVESAVAWKSAIENRTGPSSLLFSRQGLRCEARDAGQVANIAKGGYILKDSEGEPEAIVIATGSEVSIAAEAIESMSATEQKKVRLVSMPSNDVFDAQDDAYKNAVLPANVTKRVVVEAGVSDFWYKYAGLDGRFIGVNTFGESAPIADVYAHFGITTDNIKTTLTELL